MAFCDDCKLLQSHSVPGGGRNPPKKCCWAVNPAPTRKLSTVTPAKLGALASLLYACKICLNMSEGTRGQGDKGGRVKMAFGLIVNNELALQHH